VATAITESQKQTAARKRGAAAWEAHLELSPLAAVAPIYILSVRIFCSHLQLATAHQEMESARTC
jgi:hypothetical protein